MKVADIMRRNVTVAAPHQTLSEVAEIMEVDRLGALPVVEDGRLIGIVTDRDIVTRSDSHGKDPLVVKVRDVMTQQVVSCREDDDVGECVQRMAREQVRRLPVVARDDGNLVGIVSVEDLAAEAGPGEPEAGSLVQRIIRSGLRAA